MSMFTTEIAAQYFAQSPPKTRRHKSFHLTTIYLNHHNPDLISPLIIIRKSAPCASAIAFSPRGRAARTWLIKCERNEAVDWKSANQWRRASVYQPKTWIKTARCIRRRFGWIRSIRPCVLSRVSACICGCAEPSRILVGAHKQKSATAEHAGLLSKSKTITSWGPQSLLLRTLLSIAQQSRGPIAPKGDYQISGQQQSTTITSKRVGFFLNYALSLSLNKIVWLENTILFIISMCNMCDY